MALILAAGPLAFLVFALIGLRVARSPDGQGSAEGMKFFNAALFLGIAWPFFVYLLALL